MQSKHSAHAEISDAAVNLTNLTNLGCYCFNKETDFP